MKSEGATKHKLKQVRFRHLQKRVERELRPRPENCTYNRPLMHPLTNGTEVGTCIHPEQVEGHNLCDRTWGGCEKAKECKLFLPRKTKDEIKDDFKAELDESSFGDIAYLYPDLAALMWALGDEEADYDWEGMPDPEEVPLVALVIQGCEVQVDPQVAEVLEGVERDVEAKLTDARHTITRLETSLREAETALTEPAPKSWWQRLFGG